MKPKYIKMIYLFTEKIIWDDGDISLSHFFYYHHNYYAMTITSWNHGRHTERYICELCFDGKLIQEGKGTGNISFNDIIPYIPTDSELIIIDGTEKVHLEDSILYNSLEYYKFIKIVNKL